MTKALTILVVISWAMISHADTIIQNDGTSIHGSLLEIQAGFLLIQLPENEGEAIRRISPESIESISFSDQEHTLEQQALKRSKFIPILSNTDAKILPEYLKKLLPQDRSLEALNYAKIWHPKNPYTSLDSEYRELLINSSLKSELPDEALIHAQNWLSRTPAPYQKTLPWKIQAQHYFISEQFEEALWTCLTPIAHASHHSEHHILHTIAADSYQKLGYIEHATAHLSPNTLPAPTLPLFLDPSSQ